MTAAFSKSNSVLAVSLSFSRLARRELPEVSRNETRRPTSTSYSCLVQPAKQGARHIFISEYRQPGKVGSRRILIWQRRTLKRSRNFSEKASAERREATGP